MRVLCCLDGANAQQLRDAVASLLQAETRTMAVLYVTDSGPEVQVEQQRTRHFRPPHPPLPRREQMQQAEGMAAQDILAEGSRFLDGAEMLRRTGRPEREIVQAAQEWQADIVVVCSRSPDGGVPPLGPRSVGHVARFVLDHAPCPVLLVRTRVSRAGPLFPTP